MTKRARNAALKRLDSFIGEWRLDASFPPRDADSALDVLRLVGDLTDAFFVVNWLGIGSWRRILDDRPGLWG